MQEREPPSRASSRTTWVGSKIRPRSPLAECPGNREPFWRGGPGLETVCSSCWFFSGLGGARCKAQCTGLHDGAVGSGWGKHLQWRQRARRASFWNRRILMDAGRISRWPLCRGGSMCNCPIFHRPACPHMLCLQRRDEAAKSLVGWFASCVASCDPFCQAMRGNIHHRYRRSRVTDTASQSVLKLNSRLDSR